MVICILHHRVHTIFGHGTIIWTPEYITNLEVSDIRVGEERVLLVGVEEREVFHDDGDEQVQDNVGDNDVEAAVVRIVRLTS